MYRVLLPDGEGLTLSTSIEFLQETLERTKISSTTLFNCNYCDGANAVFVHLKKPQTSRYGFLVGNLSADEVEDIKTSMLKDGYFDFSKFNYVPYLPLSSNLESVKEDERYFDYFSEEEFEELINAYSI